MSKTGGTMTAAVVLVVLSVALGATRRIVLGPDIEGERGWLIKIKITGELPGGIKSLSLPLPPEFRRQHISGETFESSNLTNPALPKRRQTARRVIWRRPAAMDDRSLPYALTYTLRATIGTRQPTTGMAQGTRRLDRAAPDKSLLLPSQLIQSDAPAIQKQAQVLLELEKGAGPEVQLRKLYEFVEPMDEGKARGASQTLRANRGSSIGKARLLVALCRNRGIPARLLTGLFLTGEGKLPLHSWAEVWSHGRWIPVDPTNRYFGVDEFPEMYLVLRIGDDGFRTPQGQNVEVDCSVQNLSNTGDQARTASPLRSFFLATSLHRLRPTEQHLVRFLLLLPLAALVVSIFRTLIGVPTFGTFSPALLGLAFLDVRALRWGLPIFILIILLGWVMRHGLERFHLLQVPRASALLTLIVSLLILLIVVGNNAGLVGMQYVSLFPLVILTHLVERFWTIEAEDGTMSSFKTLLGTVIVSITVSFTLSFDAMTAWMFRYPETLFVVLAAELALGRYTGYRLSELYRFGDLIQEENADGGMKETKEPTSAPPANGETGRTPHEGGGGPC